MRRACSASWRSSSWLPRYNGPYSLEHGLQSALPAMNTTPLSVQGLEADHVTMHHKTLSSGRCRGCHMSGRVCQAYMSMSAACPCTLHVPPAQRQSCGEQVNSRRAVSAEADVERLQRLLADAEKRAESLAWQVCRCGPGLYKSALTLALQRLCLDTTHMHAVEFVCTDAIG